MKVKDRIAETTFTLSLKYGFDNVSLKQIETEANATTGAIYYHFKDKNAILAYIIEKYLSNEIENFQKIIENYEAPIIEKLRFIFYYHTGLDISNKSKDLNILNNSEAIDLLDITNTNYKEYYLFLMGSYHEHPELRTLHHEMNHEFFKFYNELVEKSMKKNEIRTDLSAYDMALHIYTVMMGFITISIISSDFTNEEMIEKDLAAIWEYIKPQ
ncbi:hypothetical protein SDC9_08469 [bioreactor metagenome]|uniref:HTH tetR-type domain-containing protein n=1 Tax=bioreactor metagenome TaxID=1076179 RepID=A0A644T7V8_9ZZZZ|nr:TetR/AcrR family transcriptional regulator [Methanobrevibacter sp.]MEA4957227.1 TetR/AcrR family transcriptional regulator [Methanobrevibacter sp.]